MDMLLTIMMLMGYVFELNGSKAIDREREIEKERMWKEKESTPVVVVIWSIVSAYI